jgi:hypothetical protein
MAEQQSLGDKITSGLQNALEVGPNATRQAEQRQNANVGNLRYPSDIGLGRAPFIQFIPHRAQYNNSGSNVSLNSTGSSVTLYIPTNVSISDSLRYESVSTGVVGAVMEKGVENLTGDDIGAIAFQNAEAIAGVAGGAVGGKLGSTLGAIAGVGGAASVVGNIKSEISKTRQRVMNPREFMLFRAPTIRQFGYNFTFIPKSDAEARSIPNIIRFFRQAAYPSLHSGGIDYVFPDAFKIKYGNTNNSLIKIPEVVCISVNVTYNPNSVSYYTYDNMPVEISMQLSFQELKPIDQSLVAQGY